MLIIVCMCVCVFFYFSQAQYRTQFRAASEATLSQPYSQKPVPPQSGPRFKAAAPLPTSSGGSETGKKRSRWQ